MWQVVHCIAITHNSDDFIACIHELHYMMEQLTSSSQCMETSKDRLVSYACMGPILVVTNLQKQDRNCCSQLLCCLLGTSLLTTTLKWGCLLEFFEADCTSKVALRWQQAKNAGVMELLGLLVEDRQECEYKILEREE